MNPKITLPLRKYSRGSPKRLSGPASPWDNLSSSSHHPVIIDYMAGANGRWFFRDGDGPVRVSKEPKNTVDGLSLSEIIARRWE